MAAIIPTARLDVTYPAQAWGQRIYCGESLVWNLVALFGTQGASYSGFALDPSGEHLIQTPIDLWLQSGETQWSPQPGDGYTYTHGAEPSLADQSGAQVKYLRAVPPAGNPSATFDTLFGDAREEGEGFKVALYRSATAAGVPSALYLALNAPAPGDNLPDGWQGLRLAVVPGAPIRLQCSTDNVSWTDAATASALGDAGSYLKTADYHLTVDVLPKTDPSWYDDLPANAQYGDAPPSQVDVTINGGDAILTVPAQSFPAGQLGVSGQGGQWSATVARKRFGLTASASLPAQPSRAGRGFQGSPNCDFQGYAFFYADGPGGADVLDVEATVTGPQAASVTLTLDASEVADFTGYAPGTCFLSAASAEFPPIWRSPSSYPEVASYTDPDLAECLIRKMWHQNTMTLRRSATLTFTNSSGALSPGSVLQAARAATLWAGGPGFPFNPDDPAGQGLWPQVCGWTSLSAGGGQQWPWRDRQAYFQVSLEGRLRRGDPDQVTCGFMPPDDGDCHYAAMRRLAHKLGYSDDFLNFPLVSRGDATGFYYLPRGTTRSPVLQPHPSMHVGGQMETVRQLSGEPDPATGQILPMVLREGLDTTGLDSLDYFPMPVGVVNWFLNPALTLDDVGLAPEQVFQATPQYLDGLPSLNELTNAGMRTQADLSHVRSPVVYEGIDPALGAAVVGVAYNELLGDGPYADPDFPGNVGLDVPLTVISRYVTTQETAELLAALASIYLAVPAISAVLPLPFQCALDPLTVVACYEPTSQGTDAAVPYWTGDVVSRISYMDPDNPEADTQAACRLLGQPGD